MRKAIRKFYSLSEALNFTKIKTRETLGRYVSRYQYAEWAKGKVWKKVTKGKNQTSTRYIISNDWIKEFNQRYEENRLVEHALFIADEPRYTLTDIKNYCDKHKIVLVKDYIKLTREEEELFSTPPIQDKKIYQSYTSK